MNIVKPELKKCPDESALASYLGGSMRPGERRLAEGHIASCDECLLKVVSAFESVEAFRQKRREDVMKRINAYFIIMLLCFVFSFVFPRYFLQFLAAAVICGAKWIIDSRNTRMLVMIYDAWKRGGEKEASRILKNIDLKGGDRF